MWNERRGGARAAGEGVAFRRSAVLGRSSSTTCRLVPHRDLAAEVLLIELERGFAVAAEIEIGVEFHVVSPALKSQRRVDG